MNNLVIMDKYNNDTKINVNNIDNSSEKSKSVNSDSSKSRMLSENYLFIKKIGSGSFGEVYIAEYKNGGYVAAKVEDKSKSPRVRNEYKIYRYLHKKGFVNGLPKIYEFVQTPDFNIMFMQLLGPSLEDLKNKYNKKFTLDTTLLLADQLISLLENLHSVNFIHRDIKPNNFLIGRDNLRSQIFIMDFGLSKKYITNRKHIEFRDNRSLIGTARYASINMHMGIEPTRRDDLESVGYMILYFLKGRLPWQGIKKTKGKTNIDAIGEVKMCTSLDDICEGIPSCFKEYIKYCRNLKFDEIPDYTYLRNLFRNCSISMRIKPKYQWD